MGHEKEEREREREREGGSAITRRMSVRDIIVLISLKALVVLSNDRDAFRQQRHLFVIMT